MLRGVRPLKILSTRCGESATFPRHALWSELIYCGAVRNGPYFKNERSSSSATAISISCLDSFHHCESGNTPRAQTPKTRQETQSSFDQQCVHSWTMLSMNADEYLYCVLDDQKLGRSRSTHAVTHSALLP